MKIEEMNAFHLADRAGSRTPDSADSAGAMLLTWVRDAVVEAVEAGRIGPEATEDLGDVAHEIADDAPSIFTHSRWQQFADLAAYQEEPELGEWPEDLSDAARVALYQIAYRLVVALVAELADGDE